jgi:hypothetical protein
MTAGDWGGLLLLVAFATASCKDQGHLEPQAGRTSATAAGQATISGASMNEPDSGKGSDRIIDLGDASRPDRQTVVRSLTEYPASEAQRIKAIIESPEMKAKVEHMRAMATRGPLALVLVDKPLRKSVMTEVYLNAPPPVTRFFVVATATLDDEVIDRATSLALAYETQYPTDVGEVKFTLFNDGSYVRESRTNGRLEDRQFFQGFYATRHRRSEHLKRTAEQSQLTQVAYVGLAKLVSLGTP